MDASKWHHILIVKAGAGDLEGLKAHLDAPLDGGINLDYKIPDVLGGGITALYYAAQECQAAVVQELIDRGASVDEATKDGATPLFIASEFGCLMAVDALLEAGASLDTAMAPDGSTPLIVATDKGHAMVVEKLLRAGANPNIANTDVTMIGRGKNGGLNRGGQDQSDALSYHRQSP
eukprot:gene16284-17436_t